MRKYLKRYFVREGERASVVKDGVFIVPWGTTKPHSTIRYFDGTWPQPWEDFDEARSIVLLGPPRIGKSTEFEHHSIHCENGFLLSLRKVDDPNNPLSLVEAINNPSSWERFVHTEEQGELFIDALDEGKLSSFKFINPLARWLRSLDRSVFERLRIHLSCRSQDWQHIDKEKWFSLFPEAAEGEKDRAQQSDLDKDEEQDGVAYSNGTQNSQGEPAVTEDSPSKTQVPRIVVLEMMDLDREQYITFCQEKELDPSALYMAVPERARSLLVRPLTLEMITDYFIDNEGKIGSLVDLYEHSITKRLGELNQERTSQIKDKFQEIPISTKRKIVEAYACATLLCGKDLIALSDELQPYALPKGISGEDVNQERISLGCDLFQWFDSSLIRFDQPEFTNYMAASNLNRLLNDGVIAAKRIWQMVAPSSEHFEPVPRLRGMSIWLAALNRGFRLQVAKCNPGILLYDYPIELPIETRLEIWDWLVDKIGGRNYFYKQDWKDGCAALACEEIVPRLAKVLEEPSEFGAGIREIAASIAFHGKLTGLSEILVGAVQNIKDNKDFLVTAAEALAEVAPNRLDVLKCWLDVPPEKDTRCQLRGYALDFLWPNYLDVNALTNNLIDQPQKNFFGKYQSFLRKIIELVTPEQATEISKRMCDNLDTLLKKGDRLKRSNWNSPYKILEGLLIKSIELYSKQPSVLSKFEVLVDIFFTAKRKLDLDVIAEDPSLMDIINRHDWLRPNLRKLHLEKIYRLKGEGFNSNKYFYRLGEYAHIDALDLSHWKEYFDHSRVKPYEFKKAIWDNIEASWHQTKYVIDLWSWIEKCSANDPDFASIWEKYRMASLPAEDSWQRKNAIKAKNREKVRSEEEKQIKAAVKKIKGGELDWLVELYVKIIRNNKDLAKAYGVEVATAYSEGLFAHWEQAVLPELSSYYSKNSMSWRCKMIIQAVKEWSKKSSSNWSDLPKSMRLSALQAGLSQLNDFPSWYYDLASLEKDSFLSFAHESLALEDATENVYPMFAQKIRYAGDKALFRLVARQYLHKNQDTNPEIAWNLVRAIDSDKITVEEISLLWDQVKRRFTSDDEYDALRIHAILWRHQIDEGWKWLKDSYLKEARDDKDKFSIWLRSIEDAHGSGGWRSFPSWIPCNILMDILSILFIHWPPKNDQENIKQGSFSYTERDLRYHCLGRLSESGQMECFTFLQGLVNDPELVDFKDVLLRYVDDWHEHHAESEWDPLTVEDFDNVLSKGYRQISTSEEFFELVMDILEDIREQIQSGEEDLKSLCWNGDSRSPEAVPEHESKLQKLVKNQIRNHSFGRKITHFREVEVSEAKKVDIVLSCNLTLSHQAKVYVEIKRQKNDELFSSIEGQLLGQYLVDPDSSHGVYLVGWYGKDLRYYGISKKKLINICGGIPETPQQLEACMQAIADKLETDKTIKVMVIDLSPKSPPKK